MFVWFVSLGVCLLCLLLCIILLILENLFIIYFIYVCSLIINVVLIIDSKVVVCSFSSWRIAFLLVICFILVTHINMDHVTVLIKIFLDNELIVIVKQIGVFFWFYLVPFLTISTYSIASILACFCMFIQFRCVRDWFLRMQYMHIACKYAYLDIIRSRPVCGLVKLCRSFLKFYGLDSLDSGGWLILVCLAFLICSGNSAVLLVYIPFFLNGKIRF